MISGDALAYDADEVFPPFPSQGLEKGTGNGGGVSGCVPRCPSRYK